MKREEIEQAIEKGESVWGLFSEYGYEYDNVKKIDWTKVEGVELCSNYFKCFNGENLCVFYYKTFKTQAEAEHYLHHANITRIETLPFLTWEEFQERMALFFTDKRGYPMCLSIIIDAKLGKKIVLGDDYGYFGLKQIWELTEENFYKAYDECVRLFRGEE